MIDEADLSKRARARLRDELAIWLTTVRADGTPQPTPVWFLWDGSTFLVYSQVDKPKLRNIASNPKVALNLNADEAGEDVLVVTGRAELDLAAPRILDNPAYLEKYAKGIPDIGYTPESASKEYSQPIRIQPVSVRSW